MGGDFDVALITWKPDYDAFYYKQLCKHARRVYLFRRNISSILSGGDRGDASAWSRDLLVFEACQHDRVSNHLRECYKGDIRHNRSNVPKGSVFGRLIHGLNPGAG